MAIITYTASHLAMSGFAPAPGLDTPCGGVAAGSVLASPNRSGVTLQIDLGSVYTVTGVTSTLWYAGTGVDFAYSASSDGVSWGSWITSLM